MQLQISLGSIDYVEMQNSCTVYPFNIDISNAVTVVMPTLTLHILTRLKDVLVDLYAITSAAAM